MAEGNLIGVTGLAVMGANLARNMGRHGFPVAVHNRTAAKTKHFMETYAGEGSFTGAETNLIQGLRDYFGAHTYRRIDSQGSFHTRWPQDGAEVRTDG
jgi:6-phosphogluconate dehydrogenase